MVCREDGKWVLVTPHRLRLCQDAWLRPFCSHSMFWNLTTRIPIWNLLLEVTWYWALCYIWVFLFCIIRIWKGTSHSTGSKSINACSGVGICWNIDDFFISVEVRLVYWLCNQKTIMVRLCRTKETGLEIKQVLESQVSGTSATTWQNESIQTSPGPSTMPPLQMPRHPGTCAPVPGATGDWLAGKVEPVVCSET